jgi:pyridoxamine 5'-phosphate oxidase
MTLPTDPIARFCEALERARRAEPFDATAATLATAGANGRPSARMVLLKGADERGFSFFTNRESRKAGELRDNPFAALCIFWPTLMEQVRVEGRVVLASDAESDAYFATRPRGSQLGAWASAQSRPLGSRDELLAHFRELEVQFTGKEIPRPPFWGGYVLEPDRIEFWTSRENRLHERVMFSRAASGWTATELYP